MWNLVQLIMIKSRVYIPNTWKYWKVSKSRQKKEENLLLKNFSSRRQNYKSMAFFSRSSYHYNSKKKKKKSALWYQRRVQNWEKTVNLRGIFWKKENCKVDETQNLNINSLLSWLNAKLRMCKGNINASGGKTMRFLAVCDDCGCLWICWFLFFFFFNLTVSPNLFKWAENWSVPVLRYPRTTWGWQRSLGINLISKRTLWPKSYWQNNLPSHYLATMKKMRNL